MEQVCYQIQYCNVYHAIGDSHGNKFRTSVRYFNALGCGWVGVGKGNLGVILVRMCEPVFQNLPHSYTWPLKKTDPFIYLIVQNADLFIYIPLIVYTHLLLVLRKISQSIHSLLRE